MAEAKKPKKDKKLFELGPMEQILVVLGIIAFGRPRPRDHTRLLSDIRRPSLYAVVDGRRDPDLHPLVLTSFTNARLHSLLWLPSTQTSRRRTRSSKSTS